MNELDEIKNLLNAYYEGKTNTAEEKRLYKFFSQTDVPQELSADKKLFLSLSSLQKLRKYLPDWNHVLLLVSMVGNRKSRSVQNVIRK